RALDAAWSGAHETDAGAESYLALADPPGLREAMLGQASTPSASYQSELALREWTRALGGRSRGEPPAHWRWVGLGLRPRLRPGEAQASFAFVGERLCRWTATPGGVTLDTLDGDVAAWRGRVAALQQVLSEAARGLKFTGDRAPLRALSRELLPERLRSD